MVIEPRTRMGKTVQAQREEKPPFWDLFNPNSDPPKPDEELLASLRGEQYDGEGGVYFECEVVAPKSSLGRTVDVHIPAEQILAVLKLCRYAAAEQRNQAMTN